VEILSSSRRALCARRFGSGTRLGILPWFKMHEGDHALPDVISVLDGSDVGDIDVDGGSDARGTSAADDADALAVNAERRLRASGILLTLPIGPSRVGNSPVNAAAVTGRFRAVHRPHGCFHHVSEWEAGIIARAPLRISPTLPVLLISGTS